MKADNGASSRREGAKRRRRSAGAVMVEYAFLLVAFGVPVMVSTTAAGVSLINSYGAVRNNLLHSVP